MEDYWQIGVGARDAKCTGLLSLLMIIDEYGEIFHLWGDMAHFLFCIFTQDLLGL